MKTKLSQKYSLASRLVFQVQKSEQMAFSNDEMKEDRKKAKDSVKEGKTQLENYIAEVEKRILNQSKESSKPVSAKNIAQEMKDIIEKDQTTENKLDSIYEKYDNSKILKVSTFFDEKQVFIDGMKSAKKQAQEAIDYNLVNYENLANYLQVENEVKLVLTANDETSIDLEDFNTEVKINVIESCDKSLIQLNDLYKKLSTFDKDGIQQRRLPLVGKLQEQRLGFMKKTDALRRSLIADVTSIQTAYELLNKKFAQGYIPTLEDLDENASKYGETLSQTQKAVADYPLYPELNYKVQAVFTRVNEINALARKKFEAGNEQLRDLMAEREAVKLRMRMIQENIIRYTSFLGKDDPKTLHEIDDYKNHQEYYAELMGRIEPLAQQQNVIVMAKNEELNKVPKVIYAQANTQKTHNALN